MKRTRAIALVACTSVLASPAAYARDIWDLTGNDNNANTRSEIAPGALQVHDLEGVGGVADQDWFRVSQKPFSSYEVLVDGLTGGLAPVPVTVPGTELGVHLVYGGGAVVPSNSLGASGSARVLYFRNETGTVNDDDRIRVSNPLCGGACLATEQYRIRLFDTTYGISRFNNSATQVTILVLQNTSDRVVYFNAHFFKGDGTGINTYSQNIPAFGTIVLNTSQVVGVGGQSGSIIIANDGRYGVLTGKAVSLEPATGFAFDTLMVARGQ
ncbi:MAG: hypothetical protein ABW221_09785 [Vicinamibacteria bacterium]